MEIEVLPQTNIYIYMPHKSFDPTRIIPTRCAVLEQGSECFSVGRFRGVHPWEDLDRVLYHERSCEG